MTNQDRPNEANSVRIRVGQNGALRGQEQLDQWAQAVRFPIPGLWQALRSARSARSGPKFHRTNPSNPQSPPIYLVADLWGYFVNGDPACAHDWSVKQTWEE